MIFLYVIKSDLNGDLYVGICKRIEVRLKEHELGKNRYTKGLRPWRLVYREKFPNWKEARAKEKYYKSGVGKEYLRRILAS